VPTENGALTEDEARAALANCTREERELLRRLVNGPTPIEAVRLLELKHAAPRAQLVDPPPMTKETILLVATGRQIARSEEMSREWTDEAIAKVDAGTPELWREAALAAVEKVCRTKRFFTPDDVWSIGLEKPPNPRALGPVMLRASKLNWCRQTGAFVRSTVPTQHQNPIREWESLLVPRDEDLVDQDDEIGTLL
jgi:hypothetical protein